MARLPASMTFAALIAVVALAAQQPAKPSSDVVVALESARRALADGKLADAVQHATTALEFEPRSVEALALLLEASKDDADARALWAHELAAVACDAKGKLKLDKKVGALLPLKDTSIADLAAARAAALDELADFATAARKSADKNFEGVLLARWASDVGREIGHAAFEPARERAAAFAPGFPLSSAAQRETLTALATKLASAQASGDTKTAIELALILRGICAQAGFDDLEGPLGPDVSRYANAANEALARARTQLAEQIGEPLTVEQLRLMDGDERERFTHEHASFAWPGVALSPQSLYRVETVCGHATLLGAAEAVEEHHARLVKWYGSDPFTARPGLVRLVPEAFGLESEGAPFWWAGGFQGGDTTTLRFSCGTIEGLGRGLTHELTHRFAGALYPGLPAWMLEGRAVWTGAAYANPEDDEFVDDHALFGTIDDARIKGYGGREALEKLIKGTIEDYRDNYTAGYALFVFLKSWGDEDATPRYAKALLAYMKSRRTDKRDALDAFVAHFCDGKETRPADFEAFAAEFGTWATGFYWRDRKPWTKRYVESAGPSRAGDIVLDEPTWVWSRNRAEPWLGQDQARLAGKLLQRLSDKRGAMNAFTWSLAVDERWSWVDRALVELLREAVERDSAWTVVRDLERRGFAVDPPAGAAPMLARLSKTRALLGVYDATVKDYGTRGWTWAAAALAADRDRIASLVGTPSLAPSVNAPDLAASHAHAFDEPRRALMPQGWSEERLTDYERHHVDGLWCIDERNRLHVGRSAPRVGTGTTDRNANQHDEFVRSNLWLEPGRYRLRAHITPTTSYVDGAIVLGWRRRDRNVRFQFSAGDYSYSIGDKDEPAALEQVGWRLHGLFDRDYALEGATRGGAHGFGRTVSSFDVELAVDGAALHAFIDGAYLGTYHTPDGAPIEGYVGFAVSMGDIRVSAASVQRLDRSACFAPLERVPAPLLMSEPRTADFRELIGRSVVGVPLHERGALCLWLPLPDLDEMGMFSVEKALERGVERLQDLEFMVTRQALATPLCVALPACYGTAFEKIRAALLAAVPELAPKLTVLAYGPSEAKLAVAAKERVELGDAHQTWLLFVDSAGVLRAAESMHSGKKLQGSFLRWLDVFRNR